MLFILKVNMCHISCIYFICCTTLDRGTPCTSITRTKRNVDSTCCCCWCCASRRFVRRSSRRSASAQPTPRSRTVVWRLSVKSASTVSWMTTSEQRPAGDSLTLTIQVCTPLQSGAPSSLYAFFGTCEESEYSGGYMNLSVFWHNVFVNHLVCNAAWSVNLVKHVDVAVNVA